MSVALVLFLGGLACGLFYGRRRWSGIPRPSDTLRRELSEDDLNRALIERLLDKLKVGGMRVCLGLTADARAAFKALGTDACGPLVDIMRDNDKPYRTKIIAEAFVAIGPRAAPALVEATKDPAPGLREQALEALSRLDPRPETAVPTIAAALADPNPEVRETAACTLGTLACDDDVAVQALTAASKDPEPRVRRYAAWALARIGRRPTTRQR